MMCTHTVVKAYKAQSHVKLHSRYVTYKTKKISLGQRLALKRGKNTSEPDPSANVLPLHGCGAWVERSIPPHSIGVESGRIEIKLRYEISLHASEPIRKSSLNREGLESCHCRISCLQLYLR